MHSTSHYSSPVQEKSNLFPPFGPLHSAQEQKGFSMAI